MNYSCFNYFENLKKIENKLFLVIILFPVFSFSQIISGKIVSQKQIPIEFAEVILLTSENIAIKSELTDSFGNFKIEIEKGKYILQIRQIGQILLEKEIILESNINLGIIEVNETEQQLQEIVLTSKKKLIERKVDRLVFNVENSIVSSGGDAIDVLQKTPGVRVSSDNISLIGKGSIKILINGRISPLTGEDLSSYLRTLNSNDISKIEVITTPPAKYEAEGNSGLINIVLKKVKRDFFGGDLRSTYSKATFSSAFLGGGINYQKNKLSVFGNVNSGDGSKQVTETNKIFYPIQTWDTDTKIRYFTKFISARAGIDYDINDKTSVGIQYIGSTSKPDNGEKTNTNIFNIDKSLDSLLFTKANSEKHLYYHSLNGHFKTELDTIGRSMSVDLDYFIYNNNLERINETNTFLENNILIEDSKILFRNTSNQRIESISSSIDFEWPTKILNIDYGGRFSSIKNESNIGAFNFQNNVFVTNLDQTNVFEYKENIQAAYFSTSKSLKKWEFKIGLRLEFTQTEGNSITLNQTTKNNYYKLFPTAYAVYNPNENNSLSLSYSKRINRPSYGDLNPFRWFSNPYSYTEGNPFLQPAFIDNFELSHTYNDNLNTSLYLSSLNNGSDQITLIDNITNVQATVRKNFLKEYAIGLSQSYTYDKIEWLESYLQYDISYSKIKSNLQNTIDGQEGINFYTSINNSFNFNSNKTFSGQLNFWYSAPGVNGVDKISESYATELGLRYLLFNKNLQLNLVFSDMFRTNENTIKSYVNNIRQEYKNYYDSRLLRITAVYKFGNNKIRSKSKKFSNEEERNRSN